MRLLIVCVVCTGLEVGCCPNQKPVEPPEDTPSAQSEDLERLYEDLSNAPDRLLEDFDASECLRIAKYLRHGVRVVYDSRADALMSYALDPEDAHYVYAVCRMLFDNVDAGEFRRPLLGQSVFVDEGEWPLDPITLENGVPFVVATGWNLAGAPELPHQYALHCLLNYEWTEAPIEQKTDQEIRAAAESLIRRRGLTGESAEFIRRQAPD